MILRIALGLWMCAVIVASFLWLPPAKGFQNEEAARIIVFHVPNAMVSVVAFLVATIYAVRFLKTRSSSDDAKSSVSAEMGLLFAVLATVTGSVFAQIQWGAAWNWDPRETTMLILLLIYAAYFALRSATDDPERRATLSSVYAILAFVTVPFLVFVLPRALSPLHPQGTLTSRGGLSAEYRVVLSAAMAGFLGLYIWLFRLGVALAELRDLKKGD